MDPEDILSTSLDTFYGYHPVALGSAGTTFRYAPTGEAFTIAVQVPDTAAANWSLHTSGVWISSIYLADHLNDLRLQDHIGTLGPGQHLRVLELGAGSGLPGILIAKKFPNIAVTVSDYPDERLVQDLANNVARNGVTNTCRTVAHAWGSDSVAALLNGSDGFDIVIAADTLWNPEMHELFISTLRATLRKSPSSKIHLVAGLHTGRYTIQAFLIALGANGFELDDIVEKQCSGSDEREWCTFREGEDERERRRWVIWMKIRWSC